jgi:hypothetical protein
MIPDMGVHGVCREALASTTIVCPRIPVISNVDALPHSDPDTIKDILARQVNVPLIAQWHLRDLIWPYTHLVPGLEMYLFGIVMEMCYFCCFYYYQDIMDIYIVMLHGYTVLLQVNLAAEGMLLSCGTSAHARKT